MNQKKQQKGSNNLQNTQIEVNENLLNIITPPGLDISDSGTELGENVGKIFAISKYPKDADYGWLSKLSNLEGTSTSIEFEYTNPDNLIEIYDKQISEKIRSAESLKKQSDKDTAQESIASLQKLVKKIGVDKEPVGYFNIMFHIQAPNQKLLKEREKRVSSAIATEHCNKRLLRKRQSQALHAMSPYGIPNVESKNIGNRNMPISTFLGGFPMSNPGINDPGGYYIGKTASGRLNFLNMWIRNRDRVNSNWVVFGIPGTGKSTALKFIYDCEYAFGTKIFLFDPDGEYISLTKHQDIQGDVIDCTGGKHGRINPLQIRKAAVIKESDLDKEKNETMDMFFSYEDADQSNDMDLHIQTLKVFFRLKFGKEEWNPDIAAGLEETLYEVYEAAGITRETDIDTLKNEDYPIMKDLFDAVDLKSNDQKLDSYECQKYKKLRDLLFSVGKGADQLWNGPTTLETDADFVDLVISGLLEADESVKRAQFYNIITWVWHQMSKDRTRRCLFGIDEGYLVIDEEYPDLMKFIRNMSKRLRKYEGGLMFITHSVVDLLDPAVKRHGQAIIDNSCYKLILGCDGQNLEETRKLFHLTEKEVNILAQKTRGRGIFMAGNQRIDLTVDVSDDFLEMFGTAGGR